MQISSKTQELTQNSREIIKQTQFFRQIRYRLFAKKLSNKKA